MAQHDQLDVLYLRGPAAASQQLQQGYEDEVDEGEEQRAMLPKPAPSFAQADQGFGTLQVRIGLPLSLMKANTCGCREFDHAATSCSWMSPPRRVRRSIEGGPVSTP